MLCPFDVEYHGRIERMRLWDMREGFFFGLVLRKHIRRGVTRPRAKPISENPSSPASARTLYTLD